MIVRGRAGRFRPALPPYAARRFATAAMVGVVVYVLVDVVLQFLPPHYSVVSDAESNLAVGPFGWIMNLNFLGRAGLTLCAAAAIGLVGPPTRLRGAGLVLLIVAGACSAALAFLPTDINPAGEFGLRASTLAGTLHLIVASLGFFAALAAFALLTGWLRATRELRRVYPAALALVAVAAAGLLGVGLSDRFEPTLLGVAERVCLAGILGWAFVVCAAIRRTMTDPGPAGADQGSANASQVETSVSGDSDMESIPSAASQRAKSG
ncbi:DUF998 domain-containing protein [Cryobacterium sp. Sr8]|uniref:DUF998 domain-containing protein n=1 Tax=Cryobacterium sp. Sr8 TaxID=1259203 RepID=UPI001069C3EF|nr:DUF998 domain-containing protein [Cryobacterium sp. Sr8]TFD80647.1 DUF998 domain-containing protein [Cryobacterium sp. Sr8]